MILSAFNLGNMMAGDGKRIDRYEIIDLIEGNTYFAKDEYGNHVTLRLLPREYAVNPDLVRRFESRAVAAKRLQHPHIIAPVDYGREEDVAFVVMQYISDKTLQDLLHENHRFSLNDTVDIVLNICSALEYAHRRQVIHGALTPSSIVMDNFEPLVNGFGIASLANESSAYTAPEQRSGAGTSPASDQYSLAVIAYQMLTGQLPQASQILYPPHEINPELPSSVSAVLMRALEIDPERRFVSITQFTNAFLDAPFVLDLDASAPGIFVEDDYQDEFDDYFPAKAKNKIVRSRSPLVAIGLIAFVFVGAFIVFNRKGEDENDGVVPGIPPATDIAEAVNQEPIIDPIGTQFLRVRESVGVNLTFSDPDDDTVTLTAVSRDSEIAEVHVVDSVNVTVEGVSEGRTTILVTVVDGRGGTASISFFVHVTRANQLPILAQIDPQTMEPATYIDIPDIVSDPDGDPVTVTVESDNKKVATVIYDMYGFGNLTIKGRTEGVAVITVAAEDERGGIASTTFKVTVVKTPVIELPISPANALQIPINSYIRTLDPVGEYDEAAWLVMANLYMGLTDVHPDTGEIIPRMATDWSVDESGTIWTFNLRDDVGWMRYDPSTGTAYQLRPVTAGDFVYSIKRSCDPHFDGFSGSVLETIIKGCDTVFNLPRENATRDVIFGDTIKVSAPDETTLVIELQYPAGHFLSITALVAMRPVHPQTVKSLEYQRALPGDIVTNGPFFLHDTHIFTRNDTLPEDLRLEGNIDIIELVYVEEIETSFSPHATGSLMPNSHWDAYSITVPSDESQ